MGKLDSIKYTLKHKIAFLKVEKELLGKNTLRGYLHDFDKIFLYLIFNKRKAHIIHRSYAKHHIQNITTKKDKIQCIIDWECARYTKADKPLSAIEFINATMTDRRIEFLAMARELGLKG